MKDVQSKQQTFEELSSLPTIPPPKPPRTDLNVLQELEIQKKNKLDIEQPTTTYSQSIDLF